MKVISLRTVITVSYTHLGGVNFTDLKWLMKAAEIGADGKEIAPAVSLDYGQFLQATFDFLIIAFSISVSYTHLFPDIDYCGHLLR